MTKVGLEFYNQGKAKPTHDHGIPKNPDMPGELKRALSKNKKAQKYFEAFPPSSKKMLYRWILSGKLPETRTKRIKRVVENAKKGERTFI